jgi:serine/threonine-protein kinase
VHRDVKPANIMLERHDGGTRAYLSDFGLTKRIASASALTATGVVVGTLDYIAPEQLQGGAVDARTDVYALACVLFHTLTGQVPYPRNDDMAKMYAHAHLPPPPMLDTAPALPPRLADVIARGMAKDPAHRFASAGDLGRAAVAACAGHAPPAVERSVATGAAAPPTQVGQTVAATPPPGPPPAPGPPPGAPAPQYEAPTNVLPAQRRWPLFAALAIALVAVGVAAAVVLSTQGDGDDPTTQATTTQPATSETEETTTDTTQPPELPATATRFEQYRSEASGFQADLPTGSGWSEPTESSPSDQLFAVTLDGPDGLELVINYTPGEAAQITPSDSCRAVDHPEFAQAQKCVFSGGRIDACQRTQCVDYLLNDGPDGPGWAVLVGGGPASRSEAIARRVADSFTPLGVGG